MALAPIIDKIDSVPEAVRGAYVEKDGKFHLDLPEGYEEVSGLKSAIAAERKTAKEASAAVAAWKKLGKTPDEIGELLAASEKEKEDALKKAGNFDEVLKKHQENWAKQSAEQVTKLTTERDAALGSEKSAIIETRVSTALTKAKATAEGLDLLTERLGKRIKFEIGADGKRITTILSADGETPMVGSGAGGLATYDDLVKEAVKSYPALFEGTGVGGSGMDSKGQRRDASGKTMTRKDFEALSPVDRSAKMKAGFKLVD